MYSDRFNAVKKMYKHLRKNNEAYVKAQANVAKYAHQLQYLEGLRNTLTFLDRLIAQQEQEWQDKVLRCIESEIYQDLAIVYPDDGYQVLLTPRILRGKIHVDAIVQSPYGGRMCGEMSDAQGRLFQQIVSFASLLVIMRLLGVDTVYIDEAFFGASKANVTKINRLLQDVQARGFNIILIAQDTSMAIGTEANVIFLHRSVDNKTTIGGK